MASRGRSQVAHRTARISLTVVQWEHSHGDRDGLEEHRQLKNTETTPSTSRFSSLCSCADLEVLAGVVTFLWCPLRSG